MTVRLEKGHQEPVLAQPRQEPGEGLPPKGRESSDLQGSRAPARSHLAASGIRALLPLHPQELTTEPELVVVLGALQQATHTHRALFRSASRKDTDESGVCGEDRHFT